MDMKGGKEMLSARITSLTAAVLAALFVSGCSASQPSVQPVIPAPPENGEESLLVVKDDTAPSAPDLSEGPSDGPAEDLVTLNREEERSFALFCPMLSEIQFRDMLLQDGADFVPDRLTHFEDRYFAYYNSGSRELVVCDAALRWFRNIVTGADAGDRILNAVWFNENCLLVLTGNEEHQTVYTYLMTEQELRPVFEPPEGKAILSLKLNEAGKVECIMGDAPQKTSPEDKEPDPVIPLPGSEKETGPVSEEPLPEDPKPAGPEQPAPDPPESEEQNGEPTEPFRAEEENRSLLSLYPEDWPRETVTLTIP